MIGRPDELRGEVISAFVLLKHGSRRRRPSCGGSCSTRVRRELGPVAVIGELNFVRMLPKTRSGKIMRRVFKAVILDRDPGDITTIEDEGSVEEARHAWRNCAPRSRRPAESPIASSDDRRGRTDTEIATCDLAFATIGFRGDLIQALSGDVYAAAAPPRGGWGPRSLPLIE